MAYKWDIFIGYPGPDILIARQLYDLLKNRCRVFLDTECVLLGHSWMKIIQDALLASRISVFLISSSVPKAWYLNDEISLAIKLYREKKHLVIPVYLDGKPDQPEDSIYGLVNLAWCDALADGGVSGVSKKIIERLDELGIPAVASKDSQVQNENMQQLASDHFIMARNRLGSFLQKNFTEQSLKNFVEKEPDGKYIFDHIKGREYNKKEFVEIVVDLMIRRSCINQGFFKRLSEKFPLCLPHIKKVQQFFIQEKFHKDNNRDNKELKISEVSLPQTSEGKIFSWEKATIRTTLQTAIKLDRSSQWLKVVQTCKKDQNIFFLLHGHSRQSLGLFLDRIQHYLTVEARRPHIVCRVPFRIEHSRATSGAEWQNHISFALSKGQKGTAIHHLYQASRHQSVLLILGLAPLHDLTGMQLEGIKELISITLPGLLEKTCALHPIRFLMAIDYDDPDDPTHKMIDEWGLEAEETNELTYVALQEVKFPTWDEVKDYLMELRPRPGNKLMEKIRKEFETMSSSEYATFQNLAERLDRHIGDI